MQFHLNTLENSYDFLINALEFYTIADEQGTHDPDRSNLNDKKRWKMAFIFLVQASELLIKEVLSLIHPLLVFDNIDLPLQQNEKTVSFSKAIIRLSNFKAGVLTEEDNHFLLQCSKKRNDFIHSEVNISTPELKPKFCRLFSIYLKIHELTITEPLVFVDKKHQKIAEDVDRFLDSYVVFRGMEHRKEQIEQFIEEIEINKKNGFYKTKTGELVARIKYGSEDNYRDTSQLEEYPERKTCTYCGDCSAKIGEYHLDGCDIEMCPICYGQALSCDCDAVLSDEFGNEYQSPYTMK